MKRRRGNFLLNEILVFMNEIVNYLKKRKKGEKENIDNDSVIYSKWYWFL